MLIQKQALFITRNNKTFWLYWIFDHSVPPRCFVTGDFPKAFGGSPAIRYVSYRNAL